MADLITLHLNQVLKDAGISEDDLTVRQCENGKCQVSVQGTTKPEEKTFQNLDQLMTFANRWLSQHPGAAKRRGPNQHPLFSRMSQFILVDQDANPGVDTVLFSPNSFEWIRHSDAVYPSVKPVSKVETLWRPFMIQADTFGWSPLTIDDYLAMGAVVGDDAKMIHAVLKLARDSFSPEEYLKIEEPFIFLDIKDVVPYFNPAGGVKLTYLYRMDLPLLLSTLEKIQALNWRDLGFPFEKLHPTAFMKDNYGFSIKKDPTLPDFLTPFHEVHLAGHPDKKIPWTDPYLMARYEHFLQKAGLSSQDSQYLFKGRPLMDIQKDGGSYHIRIFKSTREIEREIKLPIPQAKQGYELKIPEQVKTEPFELTVHGRTLKIFAPQANENTPALIRNWGQLLSLIPEAFIPPVADRFLKRDTVSIQLSADNKSFTIQWNNPIANAIAGKYPVHLSESQDLNSLIEFVCEAADRAFPDSNSLQKAVQKYYFEGDGRGEVMEFGDNFWEEFRTFLRYQEKPQSLSGKNQTLIHWFFLAKHLSQTDHIGNISKAELFSTKTIEEIRSGYVEPGWGEESSTPIARNASPSSSVPFRLPVSGGFQAHLGQKISWGPTVGAQFYTGGPQALGGAFDYSYAKIDGDPTHRVGLSALARTQWDIFPEDRHLKGGLSLWASALLGVQYEHQTVGRITPLVGTQLGVQFFHGALSAGFDVRSNVQSGGSSLGLILQSNTLAW